MLDPFGSVDFRGTINVSSYDGSESVSGSGSEDDMAIETALVDEAEARRTESRCKTAIAGLGLFCGVFGGGILIHGLAAGGGITLSGLVVGGTLTAAGFATGGLGFLVIGIALALLYFRNEIKSGIQRGYHFIKDAVGDFNWPQKKLLMEPEYDPEQMLQAAEHPSTPLSSPKTQVVEEVPQPISLETELQRLLAQKEEFNKNLAIAQGLLKSRPDMEDNVKSLSVEIALVEARIGKCEAQRGQGKTEVLPKDLEISAEEESSRVEEVTQKLEAGEKGDVKLET